VVERNIELADFQPAKPGVHNFALLAACEATARSVLISVYPILMYRSLGDAKTVSEIYLGIGLCSLALALFTPFIGRFIPRRYLFTLGGVTMLGGNVVGVVGGLPFIPLAVLMNSLALVVLTICFSAYLLDYVERTSMGKNESLRLLYSGAAWSIGPFLGVWMMDKQPLAPFFVSSAAVLCLIGYFWYLRLGNGKVIAKALKPPANPLAFLPRFFVQPLLVAGWTFAVIRSVGWAVYIVYLPIFAVEAGMDPMIGGLSLSVSNAFLFVTPLMLRFLTRTSVRIAIITGFTGSAFFFVAAMFAAGFPPLTIGLLVLATLFLVSLDVSGGLPFLMSVKPSERGEMAAIYATFRDVSAVLSPAFARVILGFAPLAAVFGACGAALFACAIVARQLHPRLGKKRLS
jgi:ACDE family multidrug resistance protein